MFAKPCRLDPEKLASAQAEFSAMEKAGTISHSNSPWSFLLHMVKKKDGRWQMAPLQRLPHYKHRHHSRLLSIPNISEYTSRISGSLVFSKLDLHKGFYQVPMNKDDTLMHRISPKFLNYSASMISTSDSPSVYWPFLNLSS